MRGLERIVAVRSNQEHRRTIDATREIDERVQGALVSPVQILEHHDRRPLPGQILEQRPPDLIRTRATRDQPGSRAVQLRLTGFQESRTWLALAVTAAVDGVAVGAASTLIARG
jgi:hypothetical protein